MDAQGKRHKVWMPRLGACVGGTANTVTLGARCVLHSSKIPLIPVLT